MNRRIITIAALAALSAAPALAAAAAPEAEAPGHDKRTMGIGLIAGGMFGAIVGGPPGAIAGMTLAGLTTDRELAARRADRLAERTAALEHERLSLLSERMSLKARADELGRLLKHERELAETAADTALLADGLEFAVGFRTNSATPPEDVAEGLEALAMLVNAVPSLEVHLEGHADPRGSEELNRRLSLARAEAIRAELVAHGLDPGRIHVTAHGAAQVGEAGTADPDGWALQRRVSIRLESREGRLAAKP